VFSGHAEFIFDNPNKNFQTRRQKLFTHCPKKMEKYFLSHEIIISNLFSGQQEGSLEKPRREFQRETENVLLKVRK